MLHLPQVYSLNSSKARGLFRAVQKPWKSPGRFPLKQLSHIFIPETPSPSRAAHAAQEHKTSPTEPLSAPPVRHFLDIPTKQNPSELGVTALVMLQHRAAPAPEHCGALRAELLLLWCTMGAMRKGKSCTATFKCHICRFQKHKEEIIQRLFLKGAYSFHLWRKTCVERI